MKRAASALTGAAMAAPAAVATESATPNSPTALRPDQVVRLELLRIITAPTLQRDAGMAIKHAALLEAYVINGAPPQEAGGQAE